jgi:hypothetical protein
MQTGCSRVAKATFISKKFAMRIAFRDWANISESLSASGN